MARWPARGRPCSKSWQARSRVARDASLRRDPAAISETPDQCREVQGELQRCVTAGGAADQIDGPVEYGSDGNRVVSGNAGHRDTGRESRAAVHSVDREAAGERPQVANLDTPLPRQCRAVGRPESDEHDQWVAPTRKTVCRPAARCPRPRVLQSSQTSRPSTSLLALVLRDARLHRFDERRRQSLVDGKLDRPLRVTRLEALKVSMTDAVGKRLTWSRNAANQTNIPLCL